MRKDQNESDSGYNQVATIFTVYQLIPLLDLLPPHGPECFP